MLEPLAQQSSLCVPEADAFVGASGGHPRFLGMIGNTVDSQPVSAQLTPYSCQGHVINISDTIFSSYCDFVSADAPGNTVEALQRVWP